MAIPYLPSLNKDNRIVTQRGVWQSDPQTRLKNLIEDLKVTADYKSSINSIPDLWARPAMFESVLANPSHHLFSKYQAEWRGTLAVLALREMRGFRDIETLTVNVPPVEKLQPSAPVLLHIIANLLADDYKKFPDPTADSGYKVHVITFRGEPLAVAWPTLLVCPAADLQRGYGNSISWWHFDGLADPIPFLNDEEKGVLKEWLEVIRSEISEKSYQYKGKVHSKIGVLLDLLGKFIEELNVKGSSNTSRYRAGRSLNITGFCEKLGLANAIVQDEASFLATSNVLLRRNPKKPEAKNLLVIAPDMVKQWNRAASDIVVGGYYSLDVALPQLANGLFKGDEIGNTSLKLYNAELRRGEDFFTDQICIVYGESNIFPNAIRNVVLTYKGDKFNVLMPIKAELLDYLDPSFLAENISVSAKGSDIEVELRLPLKGFEAGGEKLLTVRKVYHSDTGEGNPKEIQDFSNLPMIQIWPNFVMKAGEEERWQYYYSFYHSKDEKTFYARPYWAEEEKIATRELESYGMKTGEIALGKSFPQAYICENREIGYDDSIKENSLGKEKTLGVILLKKPERPLDFRDESKVTIGIDFGTTNTVAYMSVGDEGEPFLIRFDNYDDEREKRTKKGNYRALLYDVTFNDDPVCREKGRRNFIAMTDQPSPPLTSIRTVFNTHSGSATDDAYPLLQGNIYYMDDGSNLNKDVGELSRLQTDMKWDDEEYTTGFLLELGLQCMAEAVKEGATEINWAFSYPTSFTVGKIESLNILWEGSLLPTFKEVSPRTSMSHVKYTESVAMAEYFVEKMKATRIYGIICLDIGGGSTDIAIWQGNDDDKRYQASLRFAGKDILNEQLFKNREKVLEAFKTAEEDSTINKILDNAIKARDEKQFNMHIEVLLRYYEKTIFKRLFSKNFKKEILVLVRNITLGLAGIFFYVGMVIGHMRINGKYGEYQYLPHCYVGGNGSKLLHWVGKGHFSYLSPVNNIFKKSLMVGMDIGEDKDYRRKNGLPIDKRTEEVYYNEFEITKSEEPKEEVAYGLVKKGSEEKPSSRDEGKTAVEYIIAGEDFTTSEKPDGRAVDVLNEDDFLADVKINRGLRVFKSFLQAFNEEADRLEWPVVNFEERTWDRIYMKVNQKLETNRASGRSKDVVKEPLFVCILREVLALL